MRCPLRWLSLMYAFRVSRISDSADCDAVHASAICLVDEADVVRARDRAILELGGLGWGACRFHKVALMQEPVGLDAMSSAMQTAYMRAKQSGASVILYPAGDEG